jgi:acetyl esterase/lipase
MTPKVLIKASIFSVLFFISIISVNAREDHTLNTKWSGGLTRYKDKIFSEAECRKTDDNLVYSPGVKFIQNGKTTDQDLWLDVWQPPVSDPETHRPLVIWVHGGSFLRGDEDAEPTMVQYVPRGYVFATIQYRLNGKGTTATADALAAVRFFRLPENVKKYAIDPNRIVVSGSSAGGTTSYACGIWSQDATNLGIDEGNTSWADQPSWIAATMSMAGAIYPKYRYLIDPTDTPTFMDVHGTKDTTVPYDLAVSTVEALQKTGLDATLVSVVGSGHKVREFWTDDQVFGEHIIPKLFEKVILGDQVPSASMQVPQISWGKALNHPPVAEPQNVTTDEDVAKAITLSGTDADGDTLTYSILSMPLHGTITGTGKHRTYTPELNYNGTDQFIFNVDDGKGGISSAPVSITITSVNDEPQISIRSSSLTYNAPATITVDSTASDIDGSIQQVEFFYEDSRTPGSKSLEVDTVAPYRCTRVSVPPGVYTVTAVATDNEGGTTTSNALVITVVK